MSTFHVAPGVGWSVGRVNLTLTDRRGHVCTLEYPEAAVWDLLSRGYAFEKIEQMLGHIASMEPAAADALIRTAIGRWRDAGLLEER